MNELLAMLAENKKTWEAEAKSPPGKPKAER
jgi:hypothetical protein